MGVEAGQRADRIAHVGQEYIPLTVVRAVIVRDTHHNAEIIGHTRCPDCIDY